LFISVFTTTLPFFSEDRFDRRYAYWSFVSMVCSGDTDGRVPFTSTQYAINKMKLPIKTEWYPWFHGGEVNFFFFFFYRFSIYWIILSQVNEFQNNGRTGWWVCTSIQRGLDIRNCKRGWTYGTKHPACESICIDQSHLFHSQCRSLEPDFLTTLEFAILCFIRKQ
jgi:hypothetical protein